jgi:AcrR family transcriptional regulator
MARRSFSDLPEDKRRLILETAATEFAAHDFAGASLNRIIERFGMSKSSFYYYFDDKAELFSVLMDHAGAMLAAAVIFPTHEELARDFWPQVEALFDRVLAVSEQQPWFLALGTLFYRTPDAGTADFSGVYGRVRDWVDHALLAGQASGDVRTDLPFSLLAESVFALLQALDRWSVEHYASFTAEEARDAGRVQADFLRRMLAPAS